ncbi:hypothetical protein GCK32_020390 [Trichostrongylus colubriformis]|uniref:Uncharacterized protein n=1 Tax=Trichostrongylus colubriformis TaxID=6319 RepID=A0AAN8FHL3_TRICO
MSGPVPHSQQFLELDPPAYLLPTGILDLHSKTLGNARLGALDNRPEEFSKKCTKNSDCGEEEFCDQVTIRYPENQTKIKSVKDYFPKACFPVGVRISKISGHSRARRAQPFQKSVWHTAKYL